MHDLSAELREMPDALPGAARELALRLETRDVFSVRSELLFAMYAGVAVLVAGIGLLIRENHDRIDPAWLLAAMLLASAACYAVAWRARRIGRARSLGEDHVLLLGALLFSSAVGYAELRFHLLGSGWSRHLLLLAAWHLGAAYLFGSRLVLAVALTALAAWLGVEPRFGLASDPKQGWFGIGPRGLLCAVLFWLGSLAHRGDRFREVYRQFAANFGFLGTLAMIGNDATRWVGVLVLAALVALAARVGFAEKRGSYVLYAVGYGALGLVWLESLLFRDRILTSLVGLATVVGAVMLLMKLRERLRASAT